MCPFIYQNEINKYTKGKSRRNKIAMRILKVLGFNVIEYKDFHTGLIVELEISSFPRKPSALVHHS
jgi:hypothetical protein